MYATVLVKGGPLLLWNTVHLRVADEYNSTVRVVQYCTAVALLYRTCGQGGTSVVQCVRKVPIVLLLLLCPWPEIRDPAALHCVSGDQRSLTSPSSSTKLSPTQPSENAETSMPYVDPLPLVLLLCPWPETRDPAALHCVPGDQRSRSSPFLFTMLSPTKPFETACRDSYYAFCGSFS